MLGMQRDALMKQERQFGDAIVDTGSFIKLSSP
jgi:hypothetical protein